MSVVPGTRVGRYEITAKLGEGGMGEVYRARDTTLGRDVAIKILPAAVAGDPERRARFAREARLLAALNHRHIATIHGFEDSAGVGALVMELVEGPTLDEKLTHAAWRHGRPETRLDATLAIARQIADALEAAHNKGIVHRDLKPANIKVGHDGTVKVLDFGLAKALSADRDGTDASELPTLTGTALQAGSIVGTPAYMSPEQARGDAVDRRTDIWAFGCVLYEMLAGRRAFAGKTVSDTIAAILERDADWNALPANTPPALRRLIRRCLEKSADRRLHDIADARLELDDATAGTALDERTPTAPSSVPTRVVWAILAIAAIGASVWAAWVLRPLPGAPEARLEINTAPTRDPSVAVSPDGSKIVYVVTSAGQPQLWLRSIDSPTPRPLPGTEHGTGPFWSADGRSIGFFASTRLKRIDIDGGSVQTLKSESAVPLGGSWNRDGQILFADNPAGPISLVNASGGEVTTVTRVDAPQQRGHFFPRFLPDGRHFLFYVSGVVEVQGVYVGELGTSVARRLFGADSSAVYVSGHLLFVRGGTLYAQPFDPDRRVVSGEPLPLEEHAAGRITASGAVAGTIAYRVEGPDSEQRQLVWLDRAGRQLDKVVYNDTAAQGPALSHDGRRIAVFRFAGGNMDIWSYEMARRTWDRLTFDLGDDIYPLWSPDDSTIAYGASRKGGAVNLYRRTLGTAAADEELLLASLPGVFPMDWSADGRFLIYSITTPKGDTDLWALPVDGDPKAIAVATTEFTEGLGQFSPDGKWVAYQSDRTGRLEIYVRPFPGPGSDTRVSTDGGSQARWNPKGGELFYVADDDRLMSVPIGVSSDGKRLEPGTPAGLFVTTIGSTATLRYRQQYVVSPDGQSFVMQSTVAGAGVSPIAIILNWKPKG